MCAPGHHVRDLFKPAAPSQRDPRRVLLRRHARTICDMVVSVARGPIVTCLQKQTVHVAYHPNVRLGIVLLLPNDHHLALTARTDQRGVATVNVQVHYVKASNPLRIGVEASDTSARPPRLERVTFTVALPPACRGPVSGSNGTVPVAWP